MKKILALFIVALLFIPLSFKCFASVEDGDEEIPIGRYGLSLEEDGSSVLCDEATVYSDEGGILPSSVDLRTTGFLPAIGDQYTTNSCVAFAAVYYQFTYEANKLMNVATNPGNTFCPQFVYSIAKKNLDQGITFENCYNIINKLGCIRYSDYPGFEMTEDTNGEIISVDTGWVFDDVNRNNDFLSYYSDNTSAKIDALKIRGKENYIRINTRNNQLEYINNVTDVDEGGLDLIKEQLNSGKVVVASTKFKPIYATGADGTKVVVATKEQSTGHALSIIGYDDNIGFDVNGDNVIEEWETGAFLIANSWGTSFGNNGYIWVLYDAFNKVTKCTDTDYINSHFTNRRPILVEERRAFPNDGVNNPVYCNVLYTLTVEIKDVYMIGKVNISTNKAGGIGVYYDYFSVDMFTSEEYDNYHSYPQSETNSDLIIPYYYTGDIIFDLYDLFDEFDELLGNDCRLMFIVRNNNSDLDNSDITVNSISIIDNLGNVIDNISSCPVVLDELSVAYYISDLSLQLGDINYDGVIDELDLELLEDYISASVPFSDAQRILANIDRTNGVTSFDLLLLNYYLSGYIDLSDFE